MTFMKNEKLVLEEIQKWHQEGLLEKAKKGYLDFLAQYPNHISALHSLSLLYVETGELEKAQASIEKALIIEPNHPNLSLHLANILKVKGAFQDAIDLLEQVVERYPQFASALNNLGTLYFHQQQWLKAISVFEKALDIQPNYIDAYYNLGLVFNKTLEFKKAKTVFKTLLSLAEKHPGGHFQLGCLNMKEHHYNEAISHFLFILKEHSYHIETIINLATCYLEIGEIDKAKFYYKNALEIDQHDIQAHFNLAMISLKEGKTHEAVEMLYQLLKINPNNFEAHHNLAGIFLVSNQFQNALQHYEEALRLQPQNKAIEHTIRILKREKNIDQAPREYISSLFDSYSDHYDLHLLKSLHYQIPTLFYEMVMAHSSLYLPPWDILDLGCGTGLCGEVFKAKAHTLVGIDLASKMLDEAKKKNIYSALFHEDISTFLSTCSNLYDLVIAGDVLVYMGNLESIFYQISKVMKPKAFFIFNVEINTHQSYEITATGRFSHHEDYIELLAKQHHLKLIDYQIKEIRTQATQPVLGHLYLLQKMVNFS